MKAKGHAGPKKADERASVKGHEFFVDGGGPMKYSSLGGNNSVVFFVDGYTCFKVIKFDKKKSDTTAAPLSMIANYITPQGLSIKCKRRDNGGEFEDHARAYPNRR